MTGFLLRRLLNYIVLLAMASFMIFALASVSFQPLDSLLQRNPRPPQAVIDAKAAELNLDKPIPLRYGHWVAGVVHGDFGTTIGGQPIADELGRRIGVTLRLLIIGTVMGTVLGVVVGAWGAIRQYRLSDRVITVLSLLVISTPIFVLANVLILGALRVNSVFGVQLFEYTGETSPDLVGGAGVWAQFVDRLQHLVLPTFTLALAYTAGYSRYQRFAMLDVLGQDFIRTARAKGLSRRRALFKHGLRTALIPMATLFAYSRRRVADRFGVRGEDLRLARHGGMGVAGLRDPRRQHRRGDHGLFRRVDLAGRAVVRRHLRNAGPEGSGVVTEPVTTQTATTAKSGVDLARFASRRTLVLRRFVRNKTAVVSLLLLVALFVGCYLLPPVLPYSYTDLDFTALQQPPSVEHWFGTNAIGQDLLAQTLRGMQKSMLIGVCVAFISTTIAATVGSIAGFFGGWRDRTLMWIVDLLLVVPGFYLIAIVTSHSRQSATVIWLIVLLSVFGWMISSRIVRGMTMSLREREFVAAARYMGVSNTPHHRPAHRAQRGVVPHHRHRAERRRGHHARDGVEFPGTGDQAARRIAWHADPGRHQLRDDVPLGVFVPGRRAGADRVVRQPHR